jgi:hypothetical protein
MSLRVLKLGVLCLLLSVFFVSKASALNQNPNLNIGSTNILDAVLPPPGLHMLNYIAYYTADEIMDGNGDPLPGDNDLDVMVYTPQLVYTPKVDLPKNLRIGLSTMLPFQNINLDSSIGLEENHGVVGDLIVGPFIGSAIPLGNDYTLHWFFELDTYLPVGDYDQDKDLNPSANYFSLEPFLSMTLQMPHGLAFSTRQHFTYNFKNDEYVNNAGVEGELQAGPMYHFNYSLSKTLPFIAPNFRIAVVGYYLQQLSNDEFEGNDMPNSEERVFAIGPGLSWIHKGMFLGLKTHFESGAENRPEGTKTFLQIRFTF